MPVPSLHTVTAMARALKLPESEMRELRRTAAGPSGPVPGTGLGRPIGEWEPHDLEVHPAGPGTTVPGRGTPVVRALPGYVRRGHDQVRKSAAAEAAAGRSRIVVLVGTSSTGETRACWEAVQPLAEQGWVLRHPFDPTRTHAALENPHRVGPRTVVWLNEAQHCLGHREHGERIAAAVRRLLVGPERGPVLVLCSLWPDYDREYTALPEPGAPDPHSQVCELLAGNAVHIPDTLTPLRNWPRPKPSPRAATDCSPTPSPAPAPAGG